MCQLEIKVEPSMGARQQQHKHQVDDHAKKRKEKKKRYNDSLRKWSIEEVFI